MKYIFPVLLLLTASAQAALVSTGKPADPSTATLPHWRVETPENVNLIVEPDKTIIFDAPTTLSVSIHTTGTLPVAIRLTHIELRDSTTSVSWSNVATYRQQAFAWGTWQFEAWQPMADDPATRTMWINVVPPAVMNSPVRQIKVSERPNGLLDVQAISDTGNLKLYIDGALQQISPTNRNTLETSSPYQWWDIRAPEIPTLRIVAPDGTYTELVYFRSKPTPKPTPAGTPTPTPTPVATVTPAPTPAPDQIDQLRQRQDAIEAKLDAIINALGLEL